jgi:hypothetical protein
VEVSYLPLEQIGFLFRGREDLEMMGGSPALEETFKNKQKHTAKHFQDNGRVFWAMH